MDFIPRIGFGTSRIKPDMVGEKVYEALKHGNRHLDCAYIYCNQHQVGNGIKSYLEMNPDVKRGDLFITSKLWCSQQLDIENACKTSLKEMQLDYFDLYLIHWPIFFKMNENFNGDWKINLNPDEIKKLKFPILDSKHNKDKNENIQNMKMMEFSENHLRRVWHDMENLVKKGLVKNIGVSNFSIKLLKDLLSFCKIKPFCNQIECHPLFRQRNMKSFLDKEKILLIAYSPLAKGSKELFENETMKEISKKLGKTIGQIILKWNLIQGNIVIPKTETESRMIENLNSDFELNKEEENYLKDKFKELDRLDEKRLCVPCSGYVDGELKCLMDFEF